jgi:hypothetical protein
MTIKMRFSASAEGWTLDADQRVVTVTMHVVVEVIRYICSFARLLEVVSRSGTNGVTERDVGN